MSQADSLEQSKKILSLQAIRAITCLVIYVYHATQISPLGQWGVSVFFILSGFVMTLSYWERPIEATEKMQLSFLSQESSHYFNFM